MKVTRWDAQDFITLLDRRSDVDTAFSFPDDTVPSVEAVEIMIQEVLEQWLSARPDLARQVQKE